MRTSIVSFTLAALSLFATATAVGFDGNSSSVRLKPQFARHNFDTPRFLDHTQLEKNATRRNVTLHTRQSDNEELPTGTCAPGRPCVNGACCSSDGLCGYSPDHCGSNVCLSNCDAKAECGQYAVAGQQTCPLNVCCSSFGFCGTTEEFCTTGGDRPCQEGFGTCGLPNKPSCGQTGRIRKRTIGYYEGWSPSRSCDAREPEDLDITALTHAYFSFAYIDPATHRITPMSASDVPLYTRFSNLKQKKPSLETWIAVGGWALNDPGNIPDTRTAFSDMARSAASRRVFIDSLIEFMETYNFDGVDLDWEYPTAEDRGGSPGDTENLNALLKDMRQRFGNSYGISIAIPASYWYLRHFDVSTMTKYVDWLNVMSYDIHGVWDGTNEHTGPFVRPHTNWTQIDNALSLLWRNDIDPFQVTLGLGWYGRSFTLENPACTEPGCRFSSGGRPGECTESSGTLSNSEISRVISTNGLEPSFDYEAAVKWISWEDQWVSYDDGQSTQLKIERADSMCLGGTMIWAIDLDDNDNTSSNNLLGIGASNGVSDESREMARVGISDMQTTADISNACYWSFCGGGCEDGFMATTTARGKITGNSLDYECDGGRVKTLCCAAGTTMGRCKWNGWRGVGMPCYNQCDSPTAVPIAGNTNNYVSVPENDILVDETCNGGSQQYCCEGFKPSAKISTKSLSLLGRSEPQGRTNDRRDITARATSSSNDGCEAVGILRILGSLGTPWAPALLHLVEEGTVTPTICLGSLVARDTGSIYMDAFGIIAVDSFSGMQSKPPIQITSGHNTRSGGNRAPQNGVNKRPSRPPPTRDSTGRRNTFGRHSVYYPRPIHTDCSVTYTCAYGIGFDEVCDNQRWAIDSLLDSQTVFHVNVDLLGVRSKRYWASSQRRETYRKNAQATQNPGERARCEVDEFPMNDLEESINKPQVVRLLNGAANGRQGNDWRDFKWAKWLPCSKVREDNDLPPPPVTWRFSPEPGRDMADGSGDKFIKKYGFDSQTPISECWATYSHDITHATVTVEDHGFRGLMNDPMFVEKSWPYQPYDKEPWTSAWQRGPNGNEEVEVYHPAHDVSSDGPGTRWLKKKRDAQTAYWRSPKDGALEIDLQGMSVEEFFAANPNLEESDSLGLAAPRPVLARATYPSHGDETKHQATEPVEVTTPTQTADLHHAHIQRHKRRHSY